jgi:DNA-binding protein WhiA
MRKDVSFTTIVKEEITSKPFSEERKKSLLAAFIKVNGELTIHEGVTSIVLNTENAKIAKYIYQILQQIYGISAQLAYLKMMKFNKTTTYRISINQGVDDLLDDLSISFLDGKISKNIVYNDDTIGGYLSGAFLASGSVNSPISSNYHLEISVDNDNYAKWLSKLLLHYNKGIFNVKITQRRKSFVLYLKKSDQIADFLILIGATDSCMEFENVRIDRDFSNIGNRLVNCDQANFEKTIKSAKRQLKDIKIINDSIGIDALKNIKQITLCHLRVDNDDATMQELASLMSEQLHENVSKSNISHLFRQLHEIADKYRGK